MRKVILQLMIDKFKVRAEIDHLQSIKAFPSEEASRINRALIDAKHEEWDRIEHNINLFFEAVNL